MPRRAVADDIEMIPQSIRRRLKLSDLRSFTGALLIRDHIEAHFITCARSEAELRKFKAKHNYCPGRSTCMTHTGDGSVCTPCRHAMANPARRNKRSEYGLMQKQRKAALREKGGARG